MFSRKGEKFRSDLRAHRVTAQIIRARLTTAAAKEAGQRFSSARLQRSTHDVALGHVDNSHLSVGPSVEMLQSRRADGPNRLVEFVCSHRLGDKAIHAGLDTAFPISLKSVSGYSDDGSAPP